MCVRVCFVLYVRGVCWCVKRMLMRVGLGPWDQNEDDNPGGTLCGPASGAPQMGGERARQRAVDRRRGPPSSAPFHF